MASRAPTGGFQRFSTVLSSAFLEWTLMFLLFFDALFSYMVTRFSRLCKLQTPCVFCSRLDHVFGTEKPGFNQDLICETHKSEISSLSFCQIHQKLADARSICESCFRSYSQLRGHLDTGEDVHDVDGDDAFAVYDDYLDNSHLLEDGSTSSPVTQICSCCTELFQNKVNATKSHNRKFIMVDDAEAGISLSSSSEFGCLRNDVRTSKLREQTFVSQILKNEEFDHISSIKYNEVKISSISGSEVLFTDDNDEGKYLVHDDEKVEYDLAYQNVEPDRSSICNSLSGTASHKEALLNIVHPSSVCYSNDTVLEELSQLENVIFSDDKAKETRIHSIPEGLSENEVLDRSVHFTRLVEEASESVYDEQINEAELHIISKISSSSYLNQIEDEEIVPQSEYVPHDPKIVVEQFSTVKDGLELNDVAHLHTAMFDDSKDWSSTDIGLRTDPIDYSQCVSNDIDLNDAYKLAVGTKDSFSSARFTEVIMGKDSSRVQEDLKLLISQISASQGLECPWHEMTPSPRVYGEEDKSILQNITKRLSLERSESGLESLDGSLVSEMEGEGAVERLKRQVELDRKSISLLYKELEEERSASAIAANQAMAMITRLQEEKAAMQMEALHYQRMMEEQADYDHEALKKCNELLTQREKEVHDLEERYRNRFSDELSTNKSVQQNSTFYDTETRPIDQECRRSKQSNLKDSLLCLEDEKAYISNLLKEFEKKLHLFSSNSACENGSSFDLNEGQLNEDINGDVLQESAVSAGVTGANGQYLDQIATGIDKQHIMDVAKVDDLIALRDQLSCLSQRLKALESDCTFLEFAINSLRNDDEGVQFVQEIARDLRALRQYLISKRTHLAS